jgi:hypothetical protein
MQETDHLLSAHAMATAFRVKKLYMTSPHMVGGLSPQWLSDLQLSTLVIQPESSAEALFTRSGVGSSER